MPDLRTIAKDPDFQKLPIEEQRKAFSEYDKDFGALPPIEQDKGIRELMGQPDKIERSLGSRLKERGKEFMKAADLMSGHNPLMAPEAVLGMGGAVVKAGGELVGAAASPLLRNWNKMYDNMPTPTQTPLGKKLENAVRGGVERYGEWSKRHPRLSKDIGNAASIASVLPIGRAERIAEEAGVREAAQGAAQGVKEVAIGAKNFVKPTPTKEEALGRVLQGQTKDLAKGERALGAVDTAGVKTYAQLQTKLDESIPVLSRQVDAELLKDPRAYKLSELSTTAKSAGGAEIQQNFVETSLGHLKELYTKINDPVRAKNVEELLQKGETQGLTKKEVNDIARQYGSEFREKAFSREGDPLTSVNAQAYENVRSGLKDVARRGLSPNAKELDATLSSIYNTKRLIDKNVEAVRRLRQKVEERGLGQKFGGMLANAVDMLSFGSAKGFVQKMFPRNVGYKMKNWIEIEERLNKNLKIVNKAIAAKTDKQTQQVLFELYKETRALPKATIEAGPPGRTGGLPALPPHYGPEPAPFGTNLGQSSRQAQFERMKAEAIARRGRGPGTTGPPLNQSIVTGRGQAGWAPATPGAQGAPLRFRPKPPPPPKGTSLVPTGIRRDYFPTADPIPMGYQGMPIPQPGSPLQRLNAFGPTPPGLTPPGNVSPITTPRGFGELPSGNAFARDPLLQKRYGDLYDEIFEGKKPKKKPPKRNLLNRSED